MKTFLFILILTGFAVYLAGAAWYYIDKATGATRLEEHVPALDLRNTAGTLDIYDYL